MRLLARDHAQLRSALKALGLHVPARVAQDCVACRREAGEVRHLAARHEAHAANGGQAQQVTHPIGGDLLGDGQCGRRDVSAPFWSQADVSQSAATATGSAPPMTKPK